MEYLSRYYKNMYKRIKRMRKKFNDIQIQNAFKMKREPRVRTHGSEILITYVTITDKLKFAQMSI